MNALPSGTGAPNDQSCASGSRPRPALLEKTGEADGLCEAAEGVGGARPVCARPDHHDGSLGLLDHPDDLGEGPRLRARRKRHDGAG
ncbi:MAG: hypothetical protein M5T61_02260 [Acidimicrobiia bacterium]|nr:hypothetical protein [Acidimicrobiia bacterium]